MNPDQRSILHINTHDAAGGAAKVAARLAAWQRDRGATASMLVGHRCDPDAPNAANFDLRPDPQLAPFCHESGAQFYEFQGSHLLGPAIATHQYLHLHNLHGGYFNPFSVALHANLRPTVWTLHDMQAFTGHCAHAFDCESWITGCGRCPRLDIEPALPADRSRALWLGKDAIYSRTQLEIVVPSRWLRDKVTKSILRHLPVHLIPNGTDTQVFAPSDRRAARRAFGLPETGLLIGAVAHGGAIANQWKGWQFSETVLAATLQRYPDLHYVSIGGEQGLEHPRVLQLPRIDDEARLAQAYSALDLFLYTPVADNCPLVVIEAMACGIPVVTFATGGIPELVRDGRDGLVVPQGDTRALAEAVATLIEAPELRQRMARQARDRAVAQFDRAPIATRYDAVYNTAQTRFSRRPTISPTDLWEYPPQMIRTPAYSAGIEYLRLATTDQNDHTRTESRQAHLPNRR